MKELLLLLVIVFIFIGCTRHDNPNQDGVGRFQIQSTNNAWNFLLLDTANGRLWQCQFYIDNKINEKWSKGAKPGDMRYCLPIDIAPKVEPEPSLWQAIKGMLE